MRPQALRVPDLQPLVRHFAQNPRNVHQLATRKHIFFDEIANAAAERAVVERVGGDTVIHDHPARLEKPVNLAEVRRQVALADVLEHPDAGDLVVRLIFRHVAIVHLPHVAAAFKSQRADALGHIRMLLLR